MRGVQFLRAGGGVRFLPRLLPVATDLSDDGKRRLRDAVRGGAFKLAAGVTAME